MYASTCSLPMYTNMSPPPALAPATCVRCNADTSRSAIMSAHPVFVSRGITASRPASPSPATIGAVINPPLANQVTSMIGFPGIPRNFPMLPQNPLVDHFTVKRGSLILGKLQEKLNKLLMLFRRPLMVLFILSQMLAALLFRLFHFPTIELRMFSHTLGALLFKLFHLFCIVLLILLHVVLALDLRLFQRD